MTRRTGHSVAFAATLALTALTVCTALAVCAALPARAEAQAQATHEPPPEAIEFYARGRQLYQEGRYRRIGHPMHQRTLPEPRGEVNVDFATAARTAFC